MQGEIILDSIAQIAVAVEFFAILILRGMVHLGYILR